MALNKQWLPNCLQMICVPPPSDSHSCGLSLAYSHQSRVVACRGTSLGRGEWAAAWPCFLSCVSVTSFVSAQLTRNHVWASETFASNSKPPHGLHSPRHWQGPGPNAAHPCDHPWSKTERESDAATHTRTPPDCHLSCLARHKGTGATRHPTWCLRGGGANRHPSLSSVRSLEFNLCHWQSPENKTNPRSVTPLPDSPLHGWLMGLETTAALHRSCCKSVTTYSLKTKSLYLLTILVKMKDRILAK